MNRAEERDDHRQKKTPGVRGRDAIWLSAAAALAVYVAVANVSTYRTDRLRGRARAWEVWSQARDVLPGQSAHGVVTAIYFLALVCLLGAAAVALWLALADGDDGPNVAPGERPEPFGRP